MVHVKSRAILLVLPLRPRRGARAAQHLTRRALSGRGNGPGHLSPELAGRGAASGQLVGKRAWAAQLFSRSGNSPREQT
eukprot:15433731-Alexandrium_andersonii.AAC.1